MCVKSHNFTKFKLMELQLQEDNIIFIYLFIYLLIYLLAETLKLGGIIGRIKRIVLRPYRRHFRSRYLSPKFIFLTVSMLFFICELIHFIFWKVLQRLTPKDPKSYFAHPTLAYSFNLLISILISVQVFVLFQLYSQVKCMQSLQKDICFFGLSLLMQPKQQFLHYFLRPVTTIYIVSFTIIIKFFIERGGASYRHH
eukprot:TRINITY_DN130_c0_g1_i6.p3 TRINITY_DN130_c0_g1~~TRINITY_DN130_c0_g1_i6.p3  ORF type:complete len:197 (+),score=-6.17 TRINITY_DN130_c0_g1_i6:70-660(+)